MKRIESLIHNKLDFSFDKKYAAIIGSAPSKGARSPLLWNKAFKSLCLNTKMFPFDIGDNNLDHVLDYLKNDPNFIGGAVAVPYKEKVFNWLEKNSNLTKESKNIGAVNCLYRGSKNELIGTNTDGEAAKLSLKNNYGSISNRNILLIGFGGAAKAVLAYLDKEVSPKGKILCLTRQFNLPRKYQNVQFINWLNYEQYMDSIEIIINCTTLGFGNQIDKSPISNQILKSKKSLFVFDIVYQPLETRLLKESKNLGFNTLNGLEMNLEQAVLAFNYAMNISDHNLKQNIKDAMKN
tara:strand:+ start:243 stop:1124 length:882 start_codon:yes stop_codon:yes gene_type:complete